MTAPKVYPRGVKYVEKMSLQTAIEVAARIWADPDYSAFVINVNLAKKIARLLMVEANRQLNREVIMVKE